MEFEFSWIIVFAFFFALGWISAKLDVKQLLSQSKQLPDSYFQGLNFLINEEPDKAIEALDALAHLDKETLELHFALGQLFRRRGELNRAISIHQNLLTRIDLDNFQRQKAQFELAQDFLKSGLHDRAEPLFLHLIKFSNVDGQVETSDYAILASRSLLELYIFQREWDSSIKIAHQINFLEKNSKLNYLIAQFHCELALAYLDNNESNKAIDALDEAMQINPQSIRALILIGDIHAKELNYQQAIDIWLTIEKINPQYLNLVAEKLLKHYRYLENLNQGLKLLIDLQHKYPQTNLSSAIFEALFSQEKYQDAYFFIQESLRKNPSLTGLEKLLEIQILECNSEERRSDLELIKNLIQQHSKHSTKYCCQKCNFQASQFYWECPACGEWEGYLP